MKTYRIHLIRHGALGADSAGKYIGGKSDVPLSAEGTRALSELKKNLWYPEADLVFTSPMLRCVQTAHLLYPDQNYMVVNELTECNFGEFEGKKYDELKKDPEFLKWAQGGMKDACPGGESGLEFSQRCYAGFSQIAEYIMKAGVSDAAVITHGGVITSILSPLCFPKLPFYEWNCENGCGFTVTTTPQLWMSGSVIELYSRIPLKNEDSE